MSWRFIPSSIRVVTLSIALVWIPSAVMAQFKDLDAEATDTETNVEAASSNFVNPDSKDVLEAQVLDDAHAKAIVAQQANARPKPIPMPELAAAKSQGVPTMAIQPVADKLIELNSPDGNVEKAEQQQQEKKPALADSQKPSKSSSEKTGNPLDSFENPKVATVQLNADIESAKFMEMQPGVSSREELIQSWGKPAATVEGDEADDKLVYQIPGVKQVDVSVDEEDVISGIVVHLEKPRKISEVAKELDISRFVAVPIPDEEGEILGQAYPERGLLLSLEEDTKDLRVTKILLETLSAEMFRLRAQYDFSHNYERSLADLDQAIQLDEKDAESFWLRAQYQDAMGQTREALKSVQKAIRLQPTKAVYRLTRARLYAKTNRIRTGIDEIKEVIREIDLPPELAGRAYNLLGDLHGMGRKADHQEALKHHLKAIDVAAKAVEDTRFAVRRAAKHVLVNAHASVARDIAMGNFQRQTEVVPKWLLRATEMADEFIVDDQGDELLQMQIFRDTLASYAELKSGEFDARVAIDEALKTGREMIREADDHFYKIQVERMLAESLFHASRIHRTRGDYDTAMMYANNALGLLDGSREEWQLVAHDDYLEAKLNFLVGSVYAVRDNDHDEAVSYYARARRLLVKSPGFTSPLYSDRGHGEMCVSMGLSYWEVGEQEEAMQLTMQGATIMKDAVEDGTLKLESMQVPYGNLAAMHNQLGNATRSKEFVKLVARINEIKSKTR